MKLWPESVRWRLTLWYTMALAAMLGVFAAASLVVLSRVLRDGTARFLEGARDSFVTELGFEYAATRTVPDAVAGAHRDIRFSDIEFLLFDASGRVVEPTGGPLALGHAAAHLASAALLQRIEEVVRAAGADPATVVVPDTEGDYHVALARTELGGGTYAVAAVRSLSSLHDTLRGVATAYVIAIPLLLALAVVGGYALARRALAPVIEMSRRARTISATDLHERLPIENARDELGDLAAMVNDLLARIEASVEERRRFVADASHELRTPAAIIRAESEVTLARPSRPEGEYREALRVIHEAGERLSRIVEDLFLLARADGGQYSLRREPIYLDELAADVARAMRAVAAQRSLEIEQDLLPDAMFSGDAELLRRMLLNLVDNAIKHAPAQSAVRVALDCADGTYRLRVADVGPGVPVEARARIFDRFYRADVTRVRSDGQAGSGAGLGLAIARWVAEAHGGCLELMQSTTAGSEFCVTLPQNSHE